MPEPPDQSPFSITVRMRGGMALFTRPETKVERVSYEVITPSAARGVLDAVFFKPQMRWVVTKIVPLAEPRFISVRRNEVTSKMPSATGWAKSNGGVTDFYTDDKRSQRNALCLRDVDYIVSAHVELNPNAELRPEENEKKYFDQMLRRLKRGQHWHQPYFGCREFPVDHVELVADPDALRREKQAGFWRVDRPLGVMLLDIDYSEQPRRAVFFDAWVRDGAIIVPPQENPNSIKFKGAA